MTCSNDVIDISKNNNSNSYNSYKLQKHNMNIFLFHQIIW